MKQPLNKRQLEVLGRICRWALVSPSGDLSVRAAANWPEKFPSKILRSLRQKGAIEVRSGGIFPLATANVELTKMDRVASRLGQWTDSKPMEGNPS